jgi:hypothetical protein
MVKKKRNVFFSPSGFELISNPAGPQMQIPSFPLSVLSTFFTLIAARSVTLAKEER